MKYNILINLQLIILEDKNEEIVGRIGRNSVRRKNILTLIPRTWLTDEVINFNFKAIESRGNIGHNCILYNSFFMSKLLDENNQYNFSKVKRYVKQEMFKKKKIILPINLHNNHWAIGVIDIEMKIIKNLDSKHNDGDLYVKALL